MVAAKDASEKAVKADSTKKTLLPEIFRSIGFFKWPDFKRSVHPGPDETLAPLSFVWSHQAYELVIVPREEEEAIPFCSLGAEN